MKTTLIKEYSFFKKINVRVGILGEVWFLEMLEYTLIIEEIESHRDIIRGRKLTEIRFNTFAIRWRSSHCIHCIVRQLNDTFPVRLTEREV